MSALETLYSGQFTSLTQLIKTNYLIISDITIQQLTQEL